MKKLAKICILLISFVSCTNNEVVNEKGLNNKFSNFEFVKSYNLLDNDCGKQLGEIVLPFYSESNTDSIIEIYNINANLFEKHYSKKENMMYEKYAVIIQYKTEIDTLFFGILKKHSELVFFNNLKKFKILTFDCHLKYYTNFEFINELGCGKIESKLNIPKRGIFYENKTFDLKNNNTWYIDSIVYGDENKASVFSGINEFTVIENKKMKSIIKEVEFYFEDYTLFILDNGNRIKHWIVSYSSGHKILLDENENYIFLSDRK